MNVLIVPTDGILTEITNDAIHLLDPSRSIDLAANVWFSIGSVAMLTLLIGLITDHVIEPRLGRYDGRTAEPGENVLTRGGVRGLRYALCGMLGGARLDRAADAAAGRAAAQPGNRGDHRRLALHEQPDRLDRPGLRRRRRRLSASARGR